MKTILALTALLSGCFLQAQTPKTEPKLAVPSEVSNAFKKAFPGAKAKWNKEKNGEFEAEFKMNKKEASANFNTMGHLKEFEIEIPTSELPVKALDYLQKKYPSAKIQEATKIIDDKNTNTFEAELKNKGKTIEVLFDVNGNYVKHDLI